MSYVQRVLQPGEQVRHSTNIHWIAYTWGVVFLLLAIVMFIFAESWPSGRGFGEVVALLLLATACGFLFWEWFTRWTTEIAVTDRRIIYKTGFISRKTTEMHMDKVESVDVEQTVLGRILDFGDVVVRGAGSGIEPILTVAAPLDLRNLITGV
jgi:uncharacterized membrane protein YdbT with pleckstrin-like domain